MARKVTGMDIKMFVATLPEGTPLAPWCRKLGISRQTAYKWRARYRAEGQSGLEERSRAPHRPFGRTPPAVEEAMVAARKHLADQGLDAGPASVFDYLKAAGMAPPSEATIWRRLRSRGQIEPAPAKRPKRSYRRFQRARPNECWQGDDTHYVLATGQEVRIINLVDDHSRCNVDSLAAANCTSVRVWESFCRAADRYGLPAEFLNDNGRAYTGRRGEQPGLFQAFVARVGVKQLRSRPHHPQTCGKVERFHLTQRRWLQARPTAATVAELQALLDCFREYYNTVRPHRSLARRTPAAVWAAQAPAAPPTTAFEPRARLWAGQVDAGGRLSAGTKASIYLGVEWAHCHVTLIRRGNEATVVRTSTGEIVRELVIDPTKRNQPSGHRRGGPRKTRRKV